MATTATRGFVTPYEAIKGVAPDVSHMRLFGAVCYAVVDKDDRHAHKGTSALKQLGVKAFLLGYQDIWNNVYITDEVQGIVVCSRHVVFNLEAADYSPLHPRAVPSSDHDIILEILGAPISKGVEEVVGSPSVPASDEAEEADQRKSAFIRGGTNFAYVAVSMALARRKSGGRGVCLYGTLDH